MPSLEETFAGSAARSFFPGLLGDGLLFESLPIGAYVCDADGLIVRCNRVAAELWGREPRLGDPAERFCGPCRLLGPDDGPLPLAASPMAIALGEGRPIAGEEVTAERPDGTRIAFLVYVTPLFGTAGDVTGTVNLLVDIGDRKAAELANRRLAAIVESSGDAILSKDVNGIIMSWNRGAERLFGYSGPEVIGKSVTILIPEDRQDEQPEILRRIRRGERIEHSETIRRRKDGSLIHISLSVSPIADPGGKIIGASKIARDISDRRRAEEQKDLLLGEMNHRVKNLFALASGLVDLSAREAGSVEELVSDVQGKFRALARAHSLTWSSGAAGIDHRIATLHDLIGEVTRPYLGDQGSRDRIVVTGPDVPLGRRAVTNVALLLHEFATNALKYGALADLSGRVRIECTLDGDDVRIVWREVGALRRAAEPTHEGFGSRLARMTIAALGGSFSREFTHDGLEIRLIAPKARISG